MCELVKHEMTHAHPTEAAPGNLATIESDVDLGEAEAQAMLRKLDAMAATSPQKEPEAVFHSRNHHCSSASDHVVSPHHRHSVWKTNDSSSISASRKAKRVTFGDVEEGGMATSTNVWDENPAARQYVLDMPESHLQTWGFLYCGGRNKLLESLAEESRNFNIPLHEEAFDW